MRNLHKEITDRIVARLKAGVVPWRQPWSGKGFGGMPRNALTQRAYSGANVILLWSRAQESGFQAPLWLTFKQALELGGAVRKGEKGESQRAARLRKWQQQQSTRQLSSGGA